MKGIPAPAELSRVIRDRKHFIILGHTDPDGDCVASQLVTASFLRRLGKTAGCFAEKPFSRHEIIPYFGEFSTGSPEIIDPDSSAVITLDCSTLDRAAGYTGALAGLPVVMIDHHSSGRPFGNIRYIDPDAPSTTILVYNVMVSLDLRPTPEEAGLLLFGLCTDTGFFRHVEAGSDDTLRAAAVFTDLGASPKDIYNRIYGGRSLDTRLLLGKLLSRAEPFLDGAGVFTCMTREDLDTHGEEAKDSDTLYALLQGTTKTVIVLLVREETDGTQTVGIRTNHTVDAGELAQKFGGGGHERAAGFSSSLGIPELREMLIAGIAEVYGKP